MEQSTWVTLDIEMRGKKTPLRNSIYTEISMIKQSWSKEVGAENGLRKDLAQLNLTSKYHIIPQGKYLPGYEQLVHTVFLVENFLSACSCKSLFYSSLFMLLLLHNYPRCLTLCFSTLISLIRFYLASQICAIYHWISLLGLP